METENPIPAIRGKAMLFAVACLMAPLSLSGRDIAELELTRRSASVQEAQELITKGDEAYLAGRYDEAVEAFAGAREMIPDAPASAELRAAATQRYAQASVEKAKQLSKTGDVATAKATMDKVLREGVAPNDPGALAMRAQLDDPIRTNPALTAEHAKDIDQVRRLLYTAEGAYNLGKFDEAGAQYTKVLRIDPTNTAARRGMERVAAAKTDYHHAAYDQTRAEMLGMVDAAWETQVSAPELGVGPGEPGGPTGAFGTVTVATKLDRIIVSRIALDQATLGEAIDFLRSIAQKEDTTAAPGETKGVNFTINLGPPDSEAARKIASKKFDLRLENVPLAQILKYITEMTGTSFRTDDFSVIITPVGSASAELISRDYRVSPDFLTSLSNGASASEANPDPFEKTGGDKAGLLTSRLSAQDALAKQGITFPEGASASYNASINTLHVVNTPTNQDIIDQIVNAIGQTEPVTISVRVTMIRTQQTNLKELGFDWLMTPYNLNTTNNIFASGGTVGSTPGRNASDFSSTIGLPTNSGSQVNPGVITNGLRSGDQAISPTTIDSLIANPNRDTQSASVAPGIMSLTGLFTDGQFQMIMRGLDQKKGVDVMARQSILTRSGQTSSVAVVQEFIYPTVYDPPELPNSVRNGSFPVTPAMPTTFDKKDVGITLEVLPVADANKHYIDVTLTPSITDFDGFVNYGSPIKSTVDTLVGSTPITLTQNAILMPVFSVRKTSTQLTVADGATVALGGLMEESVKLVEDKVPVLGDIPFLGRFFQSSSRQPSTSAIIFLVHVELLDPTGRPYRDR